MTRNLIESEEDGFHRLHPYSLDLWTWLLELWNQLQGWQRRAGLVARAMQRIGRHRRAMGLRAASVIALCYVLVLQTLLAQAISARTLDPGSLWTAAVLCDAEHGQTGSPLGPGSAGHGHDLGCCLLCARHDLAVPPAVFADRVALPAPDRAGFVLVGDAYAPRAPPTPLLDDHPPRGPPLSLA
ncbi:MAG: hypothetical protein U1E62_22055 [Alsobacter sp.]